MKLFLFLFMASSSVFSATPVCSTEHSQQLKTFFSNVASNEHYSGKQTERKFVSGKEIKTEGRGDYEAYMDNDEFEIEGGWCRPGGECDHVWFKFEIVSNCLQYWGDDVKDTSVSPTELSFLFDDSNGTQSRVSFRIKEKKYFEYDVNYFRKGKKVGTLSFKSNVGVR